MTNHKLIALILFSLLAIPQPSHSQSWPQFRGPRAGVASGANLPEKWSMPFVADVGGYSSDLNDRSVWSNPHDPHAPRSGGGAAGSPVLCRDRLYIVNDNEEQSYLLALDKRTGKEIWRMERDEKSNWSTPYIWEHDGKAEIVTAGTGKVRSYDLDGKLLWWFTGMSSI